MDGIAPTLIDTSLWIDFLRPGSPAQLKEFIAPHILRPSAHVAEPIVFELLRAASPQLVQRMQRQFDVMLWLATPPDLWSLAADLGRACRASGVACDALDLLIAAIALRHDATIVTFDGDFQRIATASDLKVERLVRP